MSNTERLLHARQNVVNYLTRNQLTEQLNRAVNELCKIRPKDPWLFLTDMLSDMQIEAPYIDRISARYALDTSGLPCLQINLFGRTASNRPSKLLCNQNVALTVASLRSRDSGKSPAPPSVAPPTENREEKEKSKELQDCDTTISQIAQVISPALRKYQLHQQTEIDEELVKLYTEHFREGAAVHKFNIVTTISTTIASVASEFLQKPLYEYLNEFLTNDNESNNGFTLPNIMVPIIHCDNTPQLSIIPSDAIDPIQRLEVVRSVLQSLETAVNEKSKTKGAQLTYHKISGAAIVSVKDVDEVLKLVESAVKTSKYELGKDVSLCLSYSNHGYTHNIEDNTYVTTGKPKPSDEMIKQYIKLLQTYPYIRYLCDPLAQSDTDGWLSLCDGIEQDSNINTTVIGSRLYQSAPENIQHGLSNKWSKGVMISTQDLFTLTHALRMSQIVDEQQSTNAAVVPTTDNNDDNSGSIATNSKLCLCLADNFSDNLNSTYAVDLAVAMNADLVCLKPFNDVGGCAKLNRWLMIAQNLSAAPSPTHTSTAMKKSVQSPLVDNEELP